MFRSLLANWLGFIRRHTNTMSCASPGDQMSLTQTLTHFPHNRPGAERADLRALGDFRPQKAWKVLRRSRWRNRPQLITRRSLVQVQPPQPQNHRFPAGKRCFSLPFCNFGGTSPFPGHRGDPNRDPDGSKNRPGGGVFASGPSCFLERFLGVYSAVVRTFSMVLAASFWAEVVTWA